MLQTHAAKKKTNETITLLEGEMRIKVPVRDILYVQADHIYIRIHLADGQKILHRMSLGSFMKKLPAKEFLQVHRSYLVNTRWVHHWDRQTVEVQGYTLPISRARSKQITRVLMAS